MRTKETLNKCTKAQQSKEKKSENKIIQILKQEFLN